jgi:peptidoglycan/LPS O-acetylase OafA/YrhL
METPPDSSPPQALLSGQKRYHDLDALRAFAMLLGIVIHGVMSFTPLPEIWPAQDVTRHENYFLVLLFIHGFRMPLFFMVSGFFAVMMWRRRGLAALAHHRARRILIPLVFGVIILVPILNSIPRLAEYNEARLEKNSIWAAAKRGDTAAIAAAIERGDPVNGRDEMQATALHWAAAYNHAESIGVLLNEGAKINAGDGKDSTPLHWAVMMGGTDATHILMEKGASVRRTNADGFSALDMVGMEKGTTQWVAGILGMEVDIDRVMAARPGIRDLLRGKTPQARDSSPQSTPAPRDRPAGGDSRAGSGNLLTDLYTIDFFSHRVFIFHHLWFLYDLILLVAGFVLVVGFAKLVRLPQLWSLFPAFVKATFRPPFCWFWIIPLSLWTHRDMPEFGPATAVGLEIDPRILTHYAVFFLAGALCYGNRGFGGFSRAWWPLFLGLAIIPFLGGIGMLDKPGESRQWLLPAASVAFCWLMIFAFVGFFRQFFAGEKPRVRYVSDSSYWLYLAHMPVVQLLQIWFSGWQFPGPLKFVLICVLSTGLLLLSYRYLVRYTLIGTVLNGRRSRPTPAVTQ